LSPLRYSKERVANALRLRPAGGRPGLVDRIGPSGLEGRRGASGPQHPGALQIRSGGSTPRSLCSPPTLAASGRRTTVIPASAKRVGGNPAARSTLGPVARSALRLAGM